MSPVYRQISPAELTPQTLPSAPTPMSDKPPAIWTQGLASSFVYRQISPAELTPHTLVLDPAEIRVRPPGI